MKKNEARKNEAQTRETTRIEGPTRAPLLLGVKHTKWKKKREHNDQATNADERMLSDEHWRRNNLQHTPENRYKCCCSRLDNTRESFENAPHTYIKLYILLFLASI